MTEPCCKPMGVWLTLYGGLPDFRDGWWISEELPPFTHCGWCGEPLVTDQPEPTDPGSDT